MRFFLINYFNWKQELRRKNETIEDYKRTGEDLETRVRQLQDLMGSSENEKDQTISSLQTTIRKMKEEFQTRDVLCHSLAEETSNLRQQLHDVAVTCQQMALRLERSEKASRALEPKHLASNLKVWYFCTKIIKWFMSIYIYYLSIILSRLGSLAPSH